MKLSKYTVGYYAALRLANALALKMKEKRVSRSKLAELTGEDRPTVSKWFRPGRNLTIFTAAYIADALDCELRMDIVEKGANRAPRPDWPDVGPWSKTVQALPRVAVLPIGGQASSAVRATWARVPRSAEDTEALECV